MIVVKTAAEIEKMRRIGRIVAQAHRLVEESIVPGITTEELDEKVARFFEEQGVKGAFLGYEGYPKNICTSVNEEVVHGIPGPRRLVEGDIVGIDIGASLDGYFADMARTLPVGEISDEARRLLQVTEEALYKGIEKAVPGGRLSDISHAIQTHVEAAGFSVVREFVGHGVGRAMHEAPQVPNFGPPGRGPRLRQGMTLAIEPMVNMKGPEVVVLEDGWTVVTRDAGLSAHFEHSVAITSDGPLIVTTLED
ncbi:MAG: type I methionyl aminopeptidase [Firmicutes bacterium]|nr:type I methionyl aminopeptidase [Bacillota bacterium]